MAPVKKAAAKKAAPKKSAPKAPGTASASALIDKKISTLNDWRGETLARLRALIKRAEPGVAETVKWRKPSNGMLGVPVWEKDGIPCTGETYKDKGKLTFAHGAALEDPAGLFNASLDGGVRRAIDFHEGARVNEKAFAALIRAAAAHNSEKEAARPRKKTKGA